MSNVITEEQKHEIEELAIEHSEALIAYGADMYHQGIDKGIYVGAVCLAIGIGVGSAICYCIDKLCKKNKNHKTE